MNRSTTPIRCREETSTDTAARAAVRARAGRPSRLGLDAWREIEAQAAAGRPIRAIAKSFGVAESTIRTRGVSAHSAQVREVAQRLASAHSALATLPTSQQFLALRLADEIRDLEVNLARAARYGAATAHELAARAHRAAQEGAQDEASVRAVYAMTKAANEAAGIGLALLAAAPVHVQPPSEPGQRPSPSTRIQVQMVIGQPTVQGSA